MNKPALTLLPEGATAASLIEHRPMKRPPDVDALRELAAAGIHQAEAARRCGVSAAIIHRLAERHGIVFKAAPPPTREHFRGLGRKSAASPLHHLITDDARRAAHRTRRERSH